MQEKLEYKWLGDILVERPGKCLMSGVTGEVEY
jgi:hypothetical protein